MLYHYRFSFFFIHDYDDHNILEPSSLFTLFYLFTSLPNIFNPGSEPNHPALGTQVTLRHLKNHIVAHSDLGLSYEDWRRNWGSWRILGAVRNFTHWAVRNLKCLRNPLCARTCVMIAILPLLKTKWTPSWADATVARCSALRTQRPQGFCFVAGTDVVNLTETPSSMLRYGWIFGMKPGDHLWNMFKCLSQQMLVLIYPKITFFYIPNQKQHAHFIDVTIILDEEIHFFGT